MRILSYVFLFVFGITFGISCKEKIKVDEQLKNISDVDSAFNYVKENPTNSNIYQLNRILRKYCQSHSDTLNSTAVLERMLEYGREKSNPYFVNIAYQNKAFEQLVFGNVESSRYWARKSLETSDDYEAIDKLDIYHLVGLSYYYPPMNQDTVMKYWKLGYQTAIEEKDEFRIFFFANNLGAFFFELDMYSIARQFFLRALNQSKLTGNVPPMLINNILTTLLIEGNNNAAMEFYNENKSILSVLPEGYENQAIILNKIHLFQMFDQFAKADSLLSEIKKVDIHGSLKAKYTSICIGQYARTLDIKYLDSVVIDNANKYGLDILDNFPSDCINVNDPNLDFLWNVLIQSTEVEVDKMAKGEEKIHSNLDGGLMILIDYYNQRNILLEKKYKLILAEFYISKGNDPIEFEHYLSEVKNVDAMFDEILNRGKEIDFQRKRNQLLYILSIFILLLFLITFLYYRNRLKLKHQTENILLQEKEILKRENSLNSRIVEFSKNLLSFNKKVKKDLDNLDFNSDNAEFLKKFRSDLLGFINVNTEINPKLIDENIVIHEERNADILEKSSLNKTEKRVYILLQEGFKANEIANMLDISTQYVYNLKAKLKRLGLEVN